MKEKTFDKLSELHNWVRNRTLRGVTVSGLTVKYEEEVKPVGEEAPVEEAPVEEAPKKK